MVGWKGGTVHGVGAGVFRISSIISISVIITILLAIVVVAIVAVVLRRPSQVGRPVGIAIIFFWLPRRFLPVHQSISELTAHVFLIVNESDGRIS